MSSVRPIPEGYHSLTPYLIVRDASRAIEFYQATLGARERLRLPAPGGRVGHAELQIGDSILMLADEHPEMGYMAPEGGGRSFSLLLYVEDVDATAGRFTAAGAKTLRPLTDQFYGDRTGTFEDPFGHIWTLATHIEDVSVEEMQRRMQAA
ncbi:MAG TPA: VOC family protein [Terriglobales bacterium]|jgi:PhnB protein|nr:VOC family protein [Terriglobales bacterium]